jgi:hypothetical protein
MVAPAYATIEQVLALFETPPVQEARLARLAGLIPTVTQQVIDACDGRDYFRHPDTGTASWSVDGDGSDILHVHEGIVSLAALELAPDGRDYTALDAADYALRGDSPWSSEPKPDAEPWFHVVLPDGGGWRRFPALRSAARLTGVRGWPAVPASLAEGVAQRVRQLAFADGSYSGSMAGGPDEFGAPSTNDRFWPQSLFNFLAHERSRFAACYVGGRR